MSVFNFFRDLFGIRINEQQKQQQQEIPNYGLEDQWQTRDDFRNPIWKIGQDDDDDDDYYGDGDNDDFRQPGRRDFAFGHFNIYNDPLELARYFENQIDGMLKNFFRLGDESTIISSSFPLFEGPENSFQNSLPSMESTQKKGNLRDEVLKPGYKNFESKNSINDKVDMDLDGKITSDELSKVWTDDHPGSFENYDNRQRNNKFFFKSFGQSISTKIIRKPDGTVEEHRVIKDSEGNEETTITQTVGDKSRRVVIRKDKDGNKSETESIDSVSGNKNPNSLIPFIGMNDGNRRVDKNPLQDFPWDKFFSFPNPKL